MMRVHFVLRGYSRSADERKILKRVTKNPEKGRRRNQNRVKPIRCNSPAASLHQTLFQAAPSKYCSFQFAAVF